MPPERLPQNLLRHATRFRLHLECANQSKYEYGEMKNPNDAEIDQLNSFLRGELSAVETYTQCIKKLDDTDLCVRLGHLRASHAARVDLLTARVAASGGAPDSSSGAWGSFAKFAEGGAGIFGSSAAIAMLEEGEDHGKSVYLANLGDLSASNRQFINAEILPEQLRTHDLLAAIIEVRGLEH
ncbi:DUF2383 domain-containing protein [Nannocystaceae bacterium ST9]